MQKISKIKIGSNRNFGLVFFFVLIIIGLWPLKNNGDVRIYFIILSIKFNETTPILVKTEINFTAQAFNICPVFSSLTPFTCN